MVDTTTEEAFKYREYNNAENESSKNATLF